MTRIRPVPGENGEGLTLRERKGGLKARIDAAVENACGLHVAIPC